MECDLSEFFERRGKYWVMKRNDGVEFPLFYCPFCGVKIDYDEEKGEVSE